MVSALVKPGRLLAKRLLLLQSGVVVVTALMAVFAVNVDWGISALIGGGIFIIANTVFATCAFMYSGARKARFVMALFYGGEVLKILITVILFAAAYLYKGVELVPLLLTYLLVLGINVFGPVFFINNNK